MTPKNFFILISLGLVFGFSFICILSFGFEIPGNVQPKISNLPHENLTWNPVIVEMIEKMNETQIYNITDVLQRTTRKYGTTDNFNASVFLFKKLSSIPGLQVEHESEKFNNVIATLPGINRTNEEIVMVGAHYDGTSSSPGATDDACGVAIVLELARIMSQYQFNRTIVFALWNDEEGGSLGSNAYAESAAKNSLKIPLYFNFDSSCYDPADHFILDIIYNDQSSWAMPMITRDNNLYGINFTLTYNKHTCHADYLPFWSHGYPAVMTHSETHGPGHTSSDTIDQVSSIYALRNGQLGMALIVQIAEVQGLRTNEGR